jgi:DNA-binding transcriptional MerR regulator
MATIGEFSQLTQVPAKTLRYYDEIGLFKPARVDPVTQYRHYGLEQLPRLYRILALKELGLSLEQIARLLDDDLSVEQIRGMLRLKHAELQAHIQAEQSRLAVVESRLRLLELEGQMSEYEVILKQVEPVRVAFVSGVTPNWAQIGATLDGMYDTVTEHLKAHNSKLPGPGITVYVDEEYHDHDIQLEAAMVAEANIPDGETVKMQTLPAYEMASVVHHGAFTGFQGAYDMLLRWIEDNNYQIVGAHREVHLQYVRDDNTADYVTEIQFPVAKRTE